MERKLSEFEKGQIAAYENSKAFVLECKKVAIEQKDKYAPFSVTGTVIVAYETLISSYGDQVRWYDQQIDKVKKS